MNRLFNKRFLRRSKNDPYAAIMGGLEAPFVLRFAYDDPDFAVGSMTRTCQIPAPELGGVTILYDILINLHTSFSQAGTSTILLDIGDEGNDDGYADAVDIETAGSIMDSGDTVSLFHNGTGTITSLTGAYLEGDRAVAGVYTAPETLTAKVTITGTLPTDGLLHVIPLFIVPTMVVNE